MISTSGYPGSRKREPLELPWCFETSKPTLGDILSQIKPHVFQQGYTSYPNKKDNSPMTKHSAVRVYGVQSYSSYHRAVLNPNLNIP